MRLYKSKILLLELILNYLHYTLICWLFPLIDRFFWFVKTVKIVRKGVTLRFYLVFVYTYYYVIYLGFFYTCYFCIFMSILHWKGRSSPISLYNCIMTIKCILLYSILFSMHNATQTNVYLKMAFIFVYAAGLSPLFWIHKELTSITCYHFK